jgi:hypothetical protein
MKVNIGKYRSHKSKKPRKINVRIDPWDTWNLDETLAHVIVPLLKQLKDTKHGVPYTSEEHAPDEFKGDDENISRHEPSGYNEKRWEWILDEMIWAFNQRIEGIESEAYYHNSDQLEFKISNLEGTDGSTAGFNHQKDPTKPPYFRDDEGLKAYEERQVNGFRLFGIYYLSLWD